MSQMTRSGMGAAMSATTSMLPSPASAFRRAASEDVRRRSACTESTSLLEHPRRERHADAERSLPFGPAFDCVLLDAPCSGLGTLERRSDIKWRRSAQDLAVLAQTQVRMLGEAAQVLRPGGRLVYSTCSSEPEENEAVVEAFLRGHPAFAVAPAVGSCRGAGAVRGYPRIPAHLALPGWP